VQIEQAAERFAVISACAFPQLKLNRLVHHT
jgi:hypothetical protein